MIEKIVQCVECKAFRIKDVWCDTLIMNVVLRNFYEPSEIIKDMCQRCYKMYGFLEQYKPRA